MHKWKSIRQILILFQCGWTSIAKISSPSLLRFIFRYHLRLDQSHISILINIPEGRASHFLVCLILITAANFLEGSHGNTLLLLASHSSWWSWLWKNLKPLGTGVMQPPWFSVQTTARSLCFTGNLQRLSTVSLKKQNGAQRTRTLGEQAGPSGHLQKIPKGTVIGWAAPVKLGLFGRLILKGFK